MWNEIGADDALFRIQPSIHVILDVGRAGGHEGTNRFRLSFGVFGEVHLRVRVHPFRLMTYLCALLIFVGLPQEEAHVFCRFILGEKYCYRRERYRLVVTWTSFT